MPFAYAKIRDDLIYTPDLNDDSYYFVKCPIRNEFFHFNEIQVTLMEALDGTRDVEDLIEVVGCEWEIELTPTDITQFEKSLGELLLLDVSSYIAEDKKVRAQIRKRLKKAGFAIQQPRSNTPESELFANGMKHALSESPLKATSYFHAVLEINPANERARQVLTCIHEAFFHCHRADLPMNSKSIRLFNPDLFLGRLDRRIGRYVYSTPGAIAIVLACLMCIPLVLEIWYSPEYTASSVGAIDAVSFAIVYFLGFLVHELGHAFSCKHYGGTPNDLGILFIYGFLPGAYCDTSDSYTFERRQDKVITFLSGVLAQLVYSAVLLAILMVISPDTPGWNGMVFAILIDITSVYGDLNPLMPLDGYYALADWLNVSNLRGKSYSYAWSIFARYAFGVTTDAFDDITKRERRIFLTYGFLSLVHLVVFVFLIVLHWMIPFLTNTFGQLGIIIAIGILLSIAKRILVDGLIPFVVFLYEERKTVFTLRRGFVYTGAFALLFVVCSQERPTHVRARFVVEPVERAFVTSYESGILQAVHVREGDKVQKGQLLASLRSSELRRSLAQAQRDVDVAEARLEMLQQGARSEELALAAARSRSSSFVRAQMSRRLKRVETLQAAEVASDAELLESRGDAVEARNNTELALRRRELLLAGTREEELAKAETELEQYRARVQRLSVRLDHYEIRSPIAGRVLTAKLHERIGEHLDAGAPLMIVADESQWKLRIFPLAGESIDGLAVGQALRARAWAFPEDEHELTIAKVLPPTPGAETRSAEYESVPLTAAQWTTGLSGHARIYGPERSFAYRYLAEPFVQTFNLKIYDVVMQR